MSFIVPNKIADQCPEPEKAEYSEQVAQELAGATTNSRKAFETAKDDAARRLKAVQWMSDGMGPIYS